MGLEQDAFPKAAESKRWPSLANCRTMGQHEQADELLERCLYALEMAQHPQFALGEPHCQAPFEKESNRPLFSALFKHMQAGLFLFSSCSRGCAQPENLMQSEPPGPVKPLLALPAHVFPLMAVTTCTLSYMGSCAPGGGRGNVS